jgi:hypothetical protein
MMTMSECEGCGDANVTMTLQKGLCYGCRSDDEVMMLERKIKKYNAAIDKVVAEKERQIDGVHGKAFKKFPHLIDDINKLKELRNV